MPVIWPNGPRTTFVHALLPGSPALDAGACVGFPDQRGGDRPQAGGCDIGAFEMTPLCRAGAGMESTRLVLRRRADGRATIKANVRLLFSDPLDPMLAPAADGLQLRIEDLGGGTLLERTVLTRPLEGVQQGCGGWRSTATRASWKSPGLLCGGDPLGKLRVTLKDARPDGGTIGVQVTAMASVPAIVGPLRVTVVLGTDTFDANLAGDADACATHVFACTADASGTRFRCS